MTPEALSTRFAELQKMEDQVKTYIIKLQADLSQSQANLNAIQGAKSECQNWLSQIAQANPPAFVPNAEPQTISANDAEGTAELDSTVGTAEDSKDTIN